jgi:gliding motility-associated-like protein
MRYLFVVVLALVAFCARANHIVGGEIEFVTLAPGRYQINLYQYWDEAQNENPIENVERSITVAVFSKKDQRLIGKYNLTFQNTTQVPYTNVMCSIDELETGRVQWSGTFQWSPKDFADPEGYLIVWERCCRNEHAINIVAPNEAGMKFILEIPALWQNNKAFINSSPGHNRPLGDYACVGSLFYADFTSIDSDGDSLAYKLTTPLNSSSQDAYPNPQPEPHINVRWKAGFSVSNTIPGTPPLSISPAGRLTVKPKAKGLYAFSVLIEEWRKIDGVYKQIGLAQRDYQLLVIENCDNPPPPVLTVIVPNQPDFNPATDLLTFSHADDKCFQFLVENVKKNDLIKFEAKAVNFDEDYDFFEGATFTIGDDNQLLVEYCAPDCPPLRNSPFVVDFMAMLDVCPLPQFDTVRMRIQIEPPPNQNAVIEPIQDAFVINEEDMVSFPFVATDADGDSIMLDVFYNDTIPLIERGISYVINVNEPGRVEGVFTWQTDCKIYDFSDRQNFKVGIRAEDQDSCGYKDPIVEWVDLKVILPTNSDPKISMPISGQIELGLDEALNFNISVTDADGDTVILRLATDGFDAASVGIVFPQQKEKAQINSSFSWTPQCRKLNLLVKDNFTLHFIAEDQDKCKVKNHDTVTLEIQIKQPVNAAPIIDKQKRNFEIEVNEPFEFEFMILDTDAEDEITFLMHSSSKLPNGQTINLSKTKGVGEFKSILSFTPECSILPFGKDNISFSLIFVAKDNACPITSQDSIKLNLVVREKRELFVGFDPPNVFTPNGDDKNATFTFHGQLDPKRNLPSDSCGDSFKQIRIYNRSGQEVFKSSDRNFSWDGGGFPAGTYFYQIEFTHSHFKDYIFLIR